MRHPALLQPSRLRYLASKAARGDVPNPDHCKWAARVPSAGVSNHPLQNSRRPSARCVTTLGGAAMKLPRRRFLHLASSAAVLPALSQSAWAQEAYPSRPVRIIMGVPAGGSADAITRLIARPLQERL